MSPNNTDSDVSRSTGATTDSESQALMISQLENMKLRAELKKLQDQGNAQAVDDNSKKKRNLPATVTDKERDIALYGRMYSLMVGPWIDTAALNSVKDRPINPRGPELRYSNKKTWKDDTITELYEFIPEHLHGVMQNHSHFASTMRHHIQNTRSNGVLAVRLKAGLIFDMKQEYFESGYNRASLDEFQALLKIPGKNEYAFLAPILFERSKYNVEKKGLFKNEVLPKILKTMLCGRSSANGGHFSISKPQTLAEIWGVTAVTAGAIAFSAILARCLLSPEKDLRKVGAVTRIKWFEDFLCYKGLLVPDTKKTRDIFKFFNERVFGHEKIADSGLLAVNENAEEFDDAMRAILDEADSSDEDSRALPDTPVDISGEHPDEDENSRPHTPSANPSTLMEEFPSPTALSAPGPSVRPISPHSTDPAIGLETATDIVEMNPTGDELETTKKNKKKTATKAARGRART